jgi:hypothetical protein
MTWLLLVFISNGWGSGDVKPIAHFPTEEACKEAGQKMSDKIFRVQSPVCIRATETPIKGEK